MLSLRQRAALQQRTTSAGVPHLRPSRIISPPPQALSKRDVLSSTSLLLLGSLVGDMSEEAALAADDFITSPSGLKYYDIREGSGPEPAPGSTVSVHWSGYTKGYQGKRIDNTSVRDEPYVFKLGAKQAIPAFEEAVSSMKPGGIRRVEVSGEIPGLAYPRNRAERFTDDLISSDLKIFKYRYGPQPIELSGQRALDFVLDNATLPDFNRTLLFDIKLLSVRR